jgi:hypothetical protein
MLGIIGLVTVAETTTDDKPPKKRYIKLKKRQKKCVTYHNGVLTVPKGWVIVPMTPEEQRWMDSIYCNK